MVIPVDQKKPPCPRSMPLPLHHLPMVPLHGAQLPARRLVRKYRRSRLRLLRSKEYQRLRAMVPSIAEKPKVSKVTVIEEAIKYIDHLHYALLARLQSKGLPQGFPGMLLSDGVQSISHSQLRDLVQHMLPASQQNSLPFLMAANPPSATAVTPAPVCERTRRTASYLQRALRLQKRRTKKDL